MAQKENHSAAQHSGTQQQMPLTATSHTACTASKAPQKQDQDTAPPLTGLLWYVGQNTYQQTGCGALPTTTHLDTAA